MNKPEAQLKSLWGPAEQASTDYGVGLADAARPALLGERAMKSVTDIWRLGVGRAPEFELGRSASCILPTSPACSIYQPVSYISTDFMDPRERLWIQPFARLIWGASERFPILDPLRSIRDFIGL
jgi:hypothetical protein